MSESLSYHLLLRLYQAQNHLDRFQNLPYNTYGKRPFHPSVVFRLTCSNIVKPIMRESFVRCEPLCWIKVCQTSDNILGSESRGSIFHRTNGSRGFSLLKPPRNASSTWHQGLSPRCLNSPSKLSWSAKYEIWRSRTLASASSPSGSAFSSTYKTTCFKTAYIHCFTISVIIHPLSEPCPSILQLTTIPKENMSEDLLTRPSV